MKLYEKKTMSWKVGMGEEEVSRVPCSWNNERGELLRGRGGCGVVERNILGRVLNAGEHEEGLGKISELRNK